MKLQPVFEILGGACALVAGALGLVDKIDRLRSA